MKRLQYLCALLASAMWALAGAQMPLPRYSPDVDLTDASYVRTVAHLPNGQIVVGGNDLQRVDGVVQYRLARLNADGSRDASWNPAPDSGVGALYVDGAGMLYVGGFFGTIAGQPRTGLARFNSAGVLDASFHPQINGGVNAIAPGLPGTLCIGGTFTTINAATHNHLGCISTVDGSEVAAFVPDLNNLVSALLTVGSNLYVAGYFTMVGSSPRYAVARLSLNGTGTADAWDAKVNSNVYALLPGAVGEIYLAGGFSFVGATARRAIAKVNDTGGALIAAFDVQAPALSVVFDISGDGSGGLIAAGAFAALGGQPRFNIARIDGSTGAAVAGFNPGVDYGYATRVLALGDGSFLVAGPFSAVGGGERLSIARVFGSGDVDPAFDAALETRGYVYVAAQLPGNGAFVIGGRFARVNGLIRRNLFKLSPLNRVDPNWIAHTDAEVRSVQVDDVGRIYVGGYFMRIGSSARNYLARLQNTNDGALDPTWNPQPNATVYPLLLRPEGLYVAGAFSAIGGGTQSNLARISTASGNLDAGWKPTFTAGGVTAMGATTTGELLLGGSFTAVNGTPRAGAAKLATGSSATLDASWAPVVNGGSAFALAVDGDDVYLGGTFTAIGAAPRGGLARLSASGAGTLDASWAPSIDSGYPYALLTRREGLYVGGNFSGIDGSGHGYLARIDPAGAVDSTWQPGLDYFVTALLPHRESIIATGFFGTTGGVPRIGVARLPAAGDTIFVDDFDG